MDEPTKTSNSTVVSYVTTATATMTELHETMSKLAADPGLRSRVEAEQRAKLPSGWSFWIDNCGFGHINAPLYISSAVPMTFDSSTVIGTADMTSTPVPSFEEIHKRFQKGGVFVYYVCPGEYSRFCFWGERNVVMTMQRGSYGEGLQLVKCNGCTSLFNGEVEISMPTYETSMEKFEVIFNDAIAKYGNNKDFVANITVRECGRPGLDTELGFGIAFNEEATPARNGVSDVEPS